MRNWQNKQATMADNNVDTNRNYQNSDPENGYSGQVHDPHNALSIKYIKLVRIFLWTIGGWPGEALGQHVPLFIKYIRKHCPIQTSIVFICQNHYIRNYTKNLDLFVKGHCYLTTILSVLTTARTALPNFKRYGDITKKFLFSFHLIHFKDKGEYYHKMYSIIETFSYYMSLYMLAMMVLGVILFNAPPFYKNYRMGAFSGNMPENVTKELTVYYSFTKFNPYEHFVPCTVFNVYLTYNCAISVCGIDLLLSLMVFQIIGHVKILRNNLNNIPRPEKVVAVGFFNSVGDECEAAVEMCTAEENDSIHEKLVECVNHHRIIVSFTNEMSDFFGPMLALNYLFHLVSCCLLLLECSRGDPDALLTFGPLTIIVFGQLIQISITFEVVGVVSEKLVDAVYGVPWECMNTKNRRLVYIFLHRVQTPIRVSVMGGASVGVTTMAGILKTTFTYFTFLRSIDE